MVKGSDMLAIVGIISDKYRKLPGMFDGQVCEKNHQQNKRDPAHCPQLTVILLHVISY